MSKPLPVQNEPQNCTLTAVDSAQPDKHMEHHQQVKDFATTHFERFRNAVKSGNGGFYHSCCFSFSTKRTCKGLNHPTNQTINFHKFMSDYQVGDILKFEQVLLQLSSELPEPFKHMAPLFNSPHTETLELGKRQDSKPDLEQEVERLKAELERAKFYQIHYYEALELVAKDLGEKEEKLHKLEYFLKFNKIDPELVLAGKTPSNNQKLKTWAPQNLGWPSMLPSFKTPSAYSNGFTSVMGFMEHGILKDEGDQHRLLKVHDPEERRRLLDLQKIDKSQYTAPPWDPHAHDSTQDDSETSQ